MASETVLDFSSVCRACLSECNTGVKLPLNDVNILVKFAICTSVPVNPNDDLPCQICIDCWAKCRSWHEFHSMCQENQRVLKNAKNKKRAKRANDQIKPEPAEMEEDMIHDPLSEIEEIDTDHQPIDQDFNFCSVGPMDEEPVDFDSFDEESQGSSTVQQRRSKGAAGGMTKKSEKQYRESYDKFMQWRKEVNCSEDEINEDQLLSYFTYFLEEKGAKPSTLAGTHSMLKSMLYQKHNIDLRTFSRLSEYTKEQIAGYVPQKSHCLTKEDIRRFLKTASDAETLDLKVILIFTVAGDLAVWDIHKLMPSDVIYVKQLNEIEVRVRNNGRSFRVVNTANFPFVDIVRKYDAVASSICDRSGFLMTYKKGKCSSIRIGRQYIAGVFKSIAWKLGLDDAELFTGQSGKATSVSLRANLPKKNKGSVLHLL